MKKVVVIVGPTATGKSETAARLAGLVGGEIISADSMQVYRGMDIGTAKPSAEQLAMAPHHLIGFADPAQEFSVAKFQIAAREAIEDVIGRDRLPIVVGGSGLYVRAVIDPLDFPAGDPKSPIRKKLIVAAEEDPQAVSAWLERVDPEAARGVDMNNPRRVITAIEAAMGGAEPYRNRRQRWQERQAIYEALIVGLTVPRERLKTLIDARVDKMIDAGLQDEVRRLLAAPKGLSITASQAIGYKEFIEYFAGRIALEEAIALIKRRTSQFAKRQMTWFKADPRVVWVETGERSAENLAQELAALVRRRGFIVS